MLLHAGLKAHLKMHECICLTECFLKKNLVKVSSEVGSDLVDFSCELILRFGSPFAVYSFRMVVQL